MVDRETFKVGCEVDVIFRYQPMVATMMGVQMAHCAMRFGGFYVEDGPDLLEVEEGGTHVKLGGLDEDPDGVVWHYYPVQDVYLSVLPEGFIERQREAQEKAQRETMLGLQRGPGPFSK